jgi:hypothetical protein
MSTPKDQLGAEGKVNDDPTHEETLRMLVATESDTSASLLSKPSDGSTAVLRQGVSDTHLSAPSVAIAIPLPQRQPKKRAKRDSDATAGR